MTKEEMRFEKRKAVVDAVSSGESPRTVARVFNVPLRTVFHWVARYRAGGYDALRDGQRSGRPRKVSGAVMRWLYDAITGGNPRQFQFEFCLWTLNIVRAMLKRVHGIELSKSGVSRLLHHLGLSPQQPIYRSYKQDRKAMERYLKKSFPQIQALARRTGARIYFVDESAVRSDAHRGMTWGKVGETPVVTDNGSRYGLNAISAISPRGDMHFLTYEDRMNGEKFVEFLRSLREDAGCPIIVIADNAGYHKSRLVRKYINSTHGEIRIHYLPPYAPELNPDEQVWNQAKSRLAKLFIESKKDLAKEVHRVLAVLKLSSDLICSFFQLESTKYAAGDCN